MNSNHHKQARAPQHFNPLARYLHWLMAGDAANLLI